jgi:hypothetical protein
MSPWIKAGTLALTVLTFASNSAFAETSEQDQKIVAAQEKIAQVSIQNRHVLQYENGKFSGPAWDKLVAEGRDAHFFMIGEEHGIAENPKLAAALYSALTPSGYSGMVIEVSPFMAGKLDAAARDGLDGLRNLYAEPGGEPPFFGMQEEAQMIADVRAAIATDGPMFWGVDYDVTSDQQLFKRLSEKSKPAAAETSLAKVKQASEVSWAKYRETRGPQYIFSFAGDPQLIRDLRESWPGRDAETSRILHTLEETLEINRAFMTGDNWGSNQRRANLIRRSFLEHWKKAKAAGDPPKLLVKMGASHLVRGRSFSEAFDLGALLPEIAAQEGKKVVSVMVLPGRKAMTAVFNPTDFSFQAAPAKDGYAEGLAPILNAVWDDEFTLIDLRPLRSEIRKTALRNDAQLLRTVMGYDMLLVLSGSTPSGELAHD